MKRKNLMLIAMLLFANALFSIAKESTDSEKIETSSVSSEKIYVIGVSDESAAFTLSQVEKVEFLGVPCITGIGLRGWVTNKPVRIPVSKIKTIIEFDSEQDLKNSKTEFYKKEYLEKD